MGNWLSNLAIAAAVASAAAAACGLWRPGLEASAQWLLLAVAFYAAGPLFMPQAIRPGRIPGALLWAGASTAAAVLLGALTLDAGPALRVAPMLLAMSSVSSLLLAALAGPPRECPAAEARLAVAALQMLLLLAPLLWGPLAELRGSGSGAPALIVALSPASHLAAAAGCDFLRLDWFYARSALGALRFDYPRTAPILAAYGTLALAIAALAARQSRRGAPLTPETSP